MNDTTTLDALNEAQHAASDRWFAARRALVAAQRWVDAAKAEELALPPPRSWEWSHRYDGALAARETAARAEAALLKEYLAAVDAFFAELDGGST